MSCPNCGTTEPGPGAFCMRCGAKLPAAAAVQTPLEPKLTPRQPHTSLRCPSLLSWRLLSWRRLRCTGPRQPADPGIRPAPVRRCHHHSSHLGRLGVQSDLRDLCAVVGPLRLRSRGDSRPARFQPARRPGR